MSWQADVDMPLSYGTSTHTHALTRPPSDTSLAPLSPLSRLSFRSCAV